MTSAFEHIPTEVATAFYGEGVDAIAHSHIYTKMRWVDESADTVLFPIPPIAGLWWTQIRIICSNKLGATVYLRYASRETIVPLLPSFSVNGSEWTILPWMLPAVPLQDQHLEVCAVLPNRGVESRAEFIRLDILGFEELAPWSSQMALSKTKREVVGLFSRVHVDAHAHADSYMYSVPRSIEDLDDEVAWLLPLTNV
jgi:hypothetical protein